ncbi:MAG: polyprenyl synthetase family protein [Candidatus Blackburnbacteria bacterium]|nr:polyprenyl synthetase family protein [Candidatus Blackburnbacteria bacterium]
MDHKAYFAPYASRVNTFLHQHLEKKINYDKEISSISSGVWEKIESFIIGGKRIRAGLVKLGYESCNKRATNSLLPVSAAIEILHGSILIHDDIADQDEIRHGNPTVHKVYEAHHKKNYKKGDSAHYGESMSIIVGDTGLYEAPFLISTSKFPEGLKIKALNHLFKYFIDTAYGELLDIDLGYRAKITEKEIMSIYTLKTAWYTICGPLQVGAILAGANSAHVKRFENYAIPLGIAFQIQDDILGIFGDEGKTGKSAASDIKEGKNTLLYTQAIKKGAPKQQRRLQSLWGDRNLTASEIEEARQIVVNSGSLKYCQKMAAKLAKRSQEGVLSITKNKELQEVYVTLADFVVNRKH